MIRRGPAVERRRGRRLDVAGGPPHRRRRAAGTQEAAREARPSPGPGQGGTAPPHRQRSEPWQPSRMKSSHGRGGAVERRLPDVRGHRGRLRGRHRRRFRLGPQAGGLANPARRSISAMRSLPSRKLASSSYRANGASRRLRSSSHAWRRCDAGRRSPAHHLLHRGGAFCPARRQIPVCRGYQRGERVGSGVASRLWHRVSSRGVRLLAIGAPRATPRIG